MFEKEIKFIVDFNLNKIRKSGTYFTVEKLGGAGIHPAIVQYISAELDLMIYEERKKLLQNSMFDYSTPGVIKYFNLIDQEIKKNKRIAFEDVRKLIVQAVSFNVNYVVRPRWSLSKLIFDPSPSRQAEEIRILLNYPYYYSYFKNIIISYLSKKQITNLSVNEFETLCSRIDTEILSSGMEKFTDNALSSIADFFNEGMAVKDRIAPELVMAFLKEKDLSPQLQRLKKAMPADAKHKYNLNEIKSIIYGTGGGVKLPVVKEEVKKDSIQPEKEESVYLEEDHFIPDEPANKKDSEEKTDIFVRVESKFPVVGDIIEELPAAEENSIDNIFSGNEEEEEKESKPLIAPTVVASNEPVQDSSGDISPAAEGDTLSKDEEKTAEEIKIPVVEDNEPEARKESGYSEEELPDDDTTSSATEREIEIDLDKETKFILPDDEIKQIYEEEEETELSGEDVKTDADEIKFDMEEKEQLDVLYEFEEDDKPSDSQSDYEEVKSELQEFNLAEMENELKQIEEELNIKPEPVKQRVPEKKKNSNAGDLFRFLSDKEIDRIISNVFNEDRDDFTSTLEKIAECSSYEESTEILKGVFLTYRVNPYSRDALTLTNAVSKYFDLK